MYGRRAPTRQPNSGTGKGDDLMMGLLSILVLLPMLIVAGAAVLLGAAILKFG
jgi:hypothetical protein